MRTSTAASSASPALRAEDPDPARKIGWLYYSGWRQLLWKMRGVSDECASAENTAAYRRLGGRYQGDGGGLGSVQEKRGRASCRSRLARCAGVRPRLRQEGVEAPGPGDTGRTGREDQGLRWGSYEGVSQEGTHLQRSHRPLQGDRRWAPGRRQPRTGNGAPHPDGQPVRGDRAPRPGPRSRTYGRREFLASGQDRRRRGLLRRRAQGWGARRQYR